MGQLGASRRRRRRFTPGVAATLGLIIIFSWFGLVKLGEVIFALRLRTDVARWDVVEQKWAGSAFALRNETVVRSPVGGAVKLLVPEGNRVKAGAVVCRVGAISVRAPASGLVSYSLDGFEEMLIGDSMLHDINVPRKAEAASTLVDGEQVGVDAPLFRVVDDLSWSLSVAVRGTQPLPSRRGVVVHFANGKVPMQVGRVEERQNKMVAQLSGDYLPKECLYMRAFDVELRTGGREGVVIPVTSLVEEEGARYGVYMLVGRAPVYRRVDVLDRNEESALVTGVPVGTRVIINPRVLRERANAA
jgi:putative membrane fusion protein